MEIERVWKSHSKNFRLFFACAIQKEEKTQRNACKMFDVKTEIIMTNNDDDYYSKKFVIRMYIYTLREDGILLKIKTFGIK